MRIVPLSDEIADFEDTAAILELVDLLISADSSPVWVMLPLVPDWRWLLERSDTPWYPSMRLYRQSARGDWRGVIGAMTKDLSGLCAERAKK